MATIARPKTREQLVEALLSVRRDLEAKGTIGKRAANQNVSPKPLMSANENVPPTPAAMPKAANDNPEPVPAPAAAPAPEQSTRPVPLRKVSAEQLSSATDDTKGGLRRDPYREPIVAAEAEQTPAPIPAAPQVASAPEVSEGVPEVDAALMRQEVTNGLAELLSKWDIFEKSGILGFGPGGMQHPTYEKIAELPMDEVLQGAWEGADADVVKTIGEYVAGWEAEQNVSPQEGDTFETYLRRVIASYLDEAVPEPANDAAAAPQSGVAAA